MDELALSDLINDVREGRCTIEEAISHLRRPPTFELGFASLDTHRALRLGLPEIVFGPGKTPEQISIIVAELLRQDGAPILVTRLEAQPAEHILRINIGGEYFSGARLAVWRPVEHRPDLPRIAVVTAGTSDQAIGDEAEEVARAIGASITRINDVGVAGIHRVLAQIERLSESDVVIVIAGMEGALPSVVAGLVATPVIAVPTSTGYGAAFDGLAALLGMLNSCAQGVVVVNIDSGFGAAMAAFRIAQAAHRIARR